MFRPKRLVASAIVLDCVISRQGVGQVKTTKTQQFWVEFPWSLGQRLADHNDQRLLNMIDVRVQLWENSDGTLERRCTAIRFSPDAL